MTDPTWLPFLPPGVRRRVGGGPSPSGDGHWPFDGAVLFADVSGFSRLAEALERQGPAGAEELSDVLEAFFRPLVAQITAHGGEISRFVGDAPIVLFPARDGRLDQAVLRAVRCALALQADLDGAVVANGVALRMKIAVTAGAVADHIVGGVGGRWLHTVTGEPLVGIGVALQRAGAGEVTVGASAVAYVAAHAVTEDRGDGVRRVLSLGVVPEEVPHEVVPAPSEDTARAFVPEHVLRRLARADARWMADLRRVTPMFVELRALAHDPASLHAAARTVQTAVDAEGGSVVQLHADDKGTVVVAAWGLPGSSHEDDAARATRAAVDLLAGLRALGVQGSVGLATGRVFCGAVGGVERRDWSMLGATVNLAARLMQCEAASSGPVCDDATRRAAGSAVGFAALGLETLKGVAEPLSIFRPVEVRGDPREAKLGPLVGRERERTLLDAALSGGALTEGGPFIVSGEPGIGKSRLVRWAIEVARERGLPVLVAATQAQDAATPYFAWRVVLDRLLGIDPLTREEGVAVALAQRPWLAEEGALLGPLVVVDLPETPRSRTLTGRARAERLHEIVLRLLREAGFAATAPALLVVEDAHWLDSSSVELLREVLRELRWLRVVLTTRPLVGTPEPGMEALLETARDRTVQLEGLAPEEVGALMAAALGAERVSMPLRALVVERSGGHPFFAGELTLALRDAGMIALAGGVADLVDAPRAGASVPSTVEGVVAARIDRLPMEVQLTLKAASVIGRTFGQGVLQDVHPMRPAREQLSDELGRLLATRLTDVERREPDPMWVFRHAIVQDVAYNQLLFSQRRALHRSVAEWYEGRFGDNLVPWASVLAHHWQLADDVPKAVEALERAAEGALAAFANREAIVLMTRARELEGAPPAGSELRRARGSRILGEAHSRLGRLEEARRHLEEAAAGLGHPVPRTSLGMVSWLLWSTLVQLAHRWLPSWFVRREEADDPRELDALATWHEIGLLAYWGHDALASVAVIVAGTNLGESSGPSPVLAQTSSAMAVIAGSVPLHGAAERYRVRAQEMADALGGPLDRAVARHNGGVYMLGAARFDASDASLREAFELYAEIGNTRRASEAALCLAYVAFYQGRLDAYVSHIAWLRASSERREDPQTFSWAARGEARVPMLLGQHAEALAALQSARALTVDTDVITLIDIDGEVARCLLALGDEAGARAAAEGTLRLLGKTPALTFAMLEGVAGAAEVLQTLHHRAAARQAPDTKALRRSARRAARALAGYARTFAFGRPIQWMLEASDEVATGRTERAARRLRAAMARADLLGMPWAGARARDALAPLSHASEAEELRRAAADLRARVLVGTEVRLAG